MTFVASLRSCCALTMASAWPRRLFSMMAVWLNTLVLAEDTIGKHVPSPANLQRPVPVVEKLDVLALKALRNFGLLQDDLLAVVVEGELRANVTLLAMTQDIVQPGSGRS